MATQLQFRRGTTAQNDAFTGAVGEISIDTSTDNLRIHDGSTAGGIELMPAGTIVAYGSASVPTGWLACNDAEISRSTYARLFAVVGTNFGTGNGSTTFNVPDLRDRVPLGKGTNMATMGAVTSGIAASAVMGSATKSGVATGASNTGTGNTGTGNTGTGNTGTGTTGGGTTGSTTQTITVGTRNVAASAKDSSTASVVNSVNTSGHTHSVPGLSVPALSIPALSVPALSVPALSIPALTVDDFSVNTTLPSQVVQYIIKI